MTINNPNKSEIETLRELLSKFNAKTIKELGEKMSLAESTNPTFNGDEIKVYFDDMDNESIAKARIINELGTVELSRNDLVQSAIKLTGRSLVDILNEAIDRHIPELIRKSTGARGVSGSADTRIEKAHEEIKKELDLGLYRTPKGKKIPPSRLARKANTSISTVKKWIVQNDLVNSYEIK